MYIDLCYDQPNKSHNAPVPYPIMRHPEQKCEQFLFWMMYYGILDRFNVWSVNHLNYHTRDCWFLSTDVVDQVILLALQWRHNWRDSVSNNQPHDCLLNRVFRRRSKKTSKLRVTGLCAGNSPGPVNSPHKSPVTRKMFPFDDVIMRADQHFITLISNPCKRDRNIIIRIREILLASSCTEK